MILYILAPVHRIGLRAEIINSVSQQVHSRCDYDECDDGIQNKWTNSIPRVDLVKDKKRDSNCIYAYWIH
jgi:hypothetical protein